MPVLLHVPTPTHFARLVVQPLCVRLASPDAAVAAAARTDALQAAVAARKAGLVEQLTSNVGNVLTVLHTAFQRAHSVETASLGKVTTGFGNTLRIMHNYRMRC